MEKMDDPTSAPLRLLGSTKSDGGTTEAVGEKEGKPSPSKTESSEPKLSSQDFEKQQKQRKGSELYAAARCPLRHMKFKMAENTSQPWLKALERHMVYLTKGGLMAALVGPRGPGKTQLAERLIRYACFGMNMRCLYTKAAEIFLEMKDTFGTSNAQRTVINQFVAPTLLVIDEIQERSGSDWENQMLTHIVDKRYDLEKSTIIIGNLETDKEIKECLGASIYSRIIETGGVVEFTWPSFREKK